MRFRLPAFAIHLVLICLFGTTVSRAALPAGQNNEHQQCSPLLTKQLARDVGNNPYKLGAVLYGALPGMQSSANPAKDRISLPLADALAAELNAQTAAQPWHREIPNLYQKIRSYPAAVFEVLNDIASEQGGDSRLWESLIQNFRMQQWPKALPKFKADRVANATDPIVKAIGLERLSRAAEEIKIGLGFLSLTGESGFPAVSAKLKAQFISQIVVGRFGTAPWNAAGQLAFDAIPSHERTEVMASLAQPSAMDHGFVATFDPVSGEWGMRQPDTGLIWFNAQLPDLDWRTAVEFCKKKNQILPDRLQWVEAEVHGIREVFPEMRTRTNFFKQFWTATLNGSSSAYVFNGYHGGVGAYYGLGHRAPHRYVRCVSAAH